MKPGLVAGCVAVLVMAALSPARTQDRAGPIEDPFRAEMNEAVARMHQGMNVPFTGDPDRDFARMMIPHHQGAVDMAMVELRHGKDEQLRRLAQEIIVAQRQEIVVMQLALARPRKER